MEEEEETKERFNTEQPSNGEEPTQGFFLRCFVPPC